MRYWFKLALGPVLGILVYWLFDFGGPSDLPDRMAGVAVWMAAWWITEVVHLSVTALLPLFLFPMLGILSTQETAINYMNQVIFLFVGGFMLAIAMERWDLHRRIALRILLWVGVTPSRILLGFMITCYLLSMWISNTATVMMLLPAALAVITQIEERLPAGLQRQHIITGLLLGLAYAGSIGGTATLVGTPPNIVFLNFYEQEFGSGLLTFSRWFLFGLPLSAIFFMIIFYFLRFQYFRGAASLNLDISYLQDAYQRLGRLRYEEKVVGTIFFLTVFLWFFRADLDLGFLTIPGWSSLFDHPDYFHDGTVAMVMATLLFLIPARKGESTNILNWDDMQKLPFGIIFLFGGGFALAQGVESSGLAQWLSESLTVLKTLAPLLIVTSLCAIMTFTTELTSNTASTQLVMPVLIALSHAIDISPLLLMIPVTFSASFAFMLPVATPPNTIIFGSQRVSIPSMAQTGIWLNLIGVLLITAAIFTLGQWILPL